MLSIPDNPGQEYVAQEFFLKKWNIIIIYPQERMKWLIVFLCQQVTENPQGITAITKLISFNKAHE